MIETNHMTTKQEDMRAEQELAKFLDIYLYDKQKLKCKHIERISDKTQQMEGKDVIIEYDDGSQVIIDEKAQLHYMDICLDTFVFEIDFIGRDNNLHTGWLYNHDLKTDTYMLIWPNKTSYHSIINSVPKKEQLRKIKEILPKIKYDDFESVDCYLIKRNVIKEYLAHNDWDEESILLKAKELRKSKTYGRTFLTGLEDFYFYFSEPFNYRESPINIVIRKNTLTKLAHQKYVVTKKELQSL